MNREIKFRAKVYHKPQKVYLGSGCQDGEWVYGDLHLQSANPHIHIKERHKEPIDVETIGQFTGLYDKNGKEIYEGDIVRKRDLTFGLKYEGVVVYNSEIGAFRIHAENNGMTMRIGFELSDVFNDGQCTIPIKYDYEVIGNVHDNSELLK